MSICQFDNLTIIIHAFSCTGRVQFLHPSAADHLIHVAVDGPAAHAKLAAGLLVGGTVELLWQTLQKHVFHFYFHRFALFEHGAGLLALNLLERLDSVRNQLL